MGGNVMKGMESSASILARGFLFGSAKRYPLPSLDTLVQSAPGVHVLRPAPSSTPYVPRQWASRFSGWLTVLRRLGETADRRPRVLILGSGELAENIMTQVQGRVGSHYRVVGCVDALIGANGNRHTIRDSAQLDSALARKRVDCIVVAMAERRGRLPVEQLLAFKMKGLRVEDGPAFLEKIAGKIPLAGLNPSFLIFNEGFQWPTTAAKRLIDLVLSTVCLILSAPLFVLLPLLMKLTSPGHIFYRQERVGLNGSRFSMLKFRSMVMHAEEQGQAIWAAEKDPRVTWLGAMMRKFRLDELPQLVNVFRGEMSFVGPRPERPEFVTSLRASIPYYDLRHTVKPGITGWAQVMYRYGASVHDAAEKLQYELFYIKHMSLALDWRIFFKTFRTVLFGVGAR